MIKLWPAKERNPVRWWVQTIVAAVWSMWGALFILTAVLDRSSGSAGHALSIALGSADPFSARGADAVAVPLAVVSWLLVPTAIGVVAALVMDELMKRARPLSEEDRTRLIKEIADAYRPEPAAPQRGGNG